MTDEGIGEIYALVREAFAAGQRAFQFQSFPFRMTAQNLVRHRTDPNLGFWRQLKEGSDRFEATGQEPSIGVADKRYVFGPFKDPARETLAQERLAQEKTRMAGLLEDGIAAVRTTYEDGGQHPTFTAQLRRGLPLGLLSRPEALTVAGREVVVIPARKKPPAPTQVAAAKPAPKDMPQPIVVAALPPGFVPLFSPQPLGTASRDSASPTLISGSPGILTASFSAASFEVAAASETPTITP
jgi:hypothetical protein